MCQWRSLLSALVCLAACAPAAWAYPTCINLVPTAKTVGAGAVSVQWESDGESGRKSAHYIYTQFGLSDQFEVGLDFYDVGTGARLYGNAKYVLFPEGRGLPGVAAGMWNIADGIVAEPYFVASRTLGSFALHAGSARSGGKWEVVGGAGVSVLKSLSVQADILSGIGGYTTYGATYALPGDLGLTLYHTRCRDRTADADYTGVNLSWTKALFR